MADPRKTTSHEDGDAVTGSAYRNGLESLNTSPPRGVQQIQTQTVVSNQTSNGVDPHDIDD
ncbi:hypothetical protein [Nocardia mangyaensis]|uniref:hypothetical protein n=1 Tax=Nocardia mangyaensis TaxID=2213200 RepID=UPI00267546D9|nr:hypothetical protein [Nocardia mangyaensis]MDO3648674.1 hypothetical protein [Nocardia mangyaensis]